MTDGNRERRWASIQKAARHAGVGISTIRRWTDAKIIPSYRIERSVRYDLNDIDDLFAHSASAHRRP